MPFTFSELGSFGRIKKITNPIGIIAVESGNINTWRQIKLRTIVSVNRWKLEVVAMKFYNNAHTVKGLNPGVVSKVGCVWSSRWTKSWIELVFFFFFFFFFLTVTNGFFKYNLCGIHFQSHLWLWRWLPHRLSTTTVLLLLSPGRSNTTYFWNAHTFD